MKQGVGWTKAIEENQANGSLNKEGEVNEHLHSPTVSGVTV